MGCTQGSYVKPSSEKKSSKAGETNSPPLNHPKPSSLSFQPLGTVLFSSQKGSTTKSNVINLSEIVFSKTIKGKDPENSLPSKRESSEEKKEVPSVDRPQKRPSKFIIKNMMEEDSPSSGGINSARATRRPSSFGRTFENFARAPRRMSSVLLTKESSKVSKASKAAHTGLEASASKLFDKNSQLLEKLSFSKKFERNASVLARKTSFQVSPQKMAFSRPSIKRLDKSWKETEIPFSQKRIMLRRPSLCHSQNNYRKIVDIESQHDHQKPFETKEIAEHIQSTNPSKCQSAYLQKPQKTVQMKNKKTYNKASPTPKKLDGMESVFVFDMFPKAKEQIKKLFPHQPKTAWPTKSLTIRSGTSQRGTPAKRKPEGRKSSSEGSCASNAQQEKEPKKAVGGILEESPSVVEKKVAEFIPKIQKIAKIPPSPPKALPAPDFMPSLADIQEKQLISSRSLLSELL